VFNSDTFQHCFYAIPQTLGYLNKPLARTSATWSCVASGTSTLEENLENIRSL